jgi:hypothetical protein
MACLFGEANRGTTFAMTTLPIIQLYGLVCYSGLLVEPHLGFGDLTLGFVRMMDQ